MNQNRWMLAIAVFAAAMSQGAIALSTFPPAPAFAYMTVYPLVPAPGDSIIVSISDPFSGTSTGQRATASDVQVHVSGGEILITATLVEYTGATDKPIDVVLPPLAEGRYVVAYDGSKNMQDPDRHRATTSFSVSKQGYVSVVEFYNASLDHYFITSAPEEIAKLDQGITRGWARTGESFRALDPAFAPSTAVPVCRMHGRPEYGIDSHFFSLGPAECDIVALRWPDQWILETYAAFSAPPMHVGPNTRNTTCSDDAQPLYRLYNNRPDANHRYTVSRAARDEMLAQGWILEGPTFDFEPEVPGDVRPIAMCVLRNVVDR